jgi:TolB-like protein
MKKISQGILLFFASLVVLSFSSCATKPSAPVYVKDGKEYGKTQGAFFRHRWWNHYERGLSYAEGQFYKEAAADMREAVEQRAKDQRMARTYGMHFIDYFPHRELGIIHYETGNLEEAKKELELSLSQYPSAKARFYLDRVRKGLIKKEGVDVGPPKIRLDLEAEEIWTRDDPVILSGVVENEHYVSAVTIQGVPLFLEGSQKHVSFKEAMDLSQGVHAIEVEAKNIMGEVGKRRVLIHVDREGPVITLEDVQVEMERPGKRLLVKGSAYDGSSVFGLTINGHAIPIQKGEEAFFTEWITTAGESLEVVASDRLGNRTSAQVNLTPTTTSKTPIILACADSGSNLLLAGLFSPKDVRPPRIKLKGWTDTQIVFLEKAFIEGQVVDHSNVASLAINETPVLRRKGRHIFFNHLAELVVGKNEITIISEDKFGNTATRKILIQRRLPAALQLSERMSTTVLPFEQKRTLSEASLSFQDSLIHYLVGRNRFRMIERDLLDTILEEQKLSQTKLIERSTALKVGKLVAAQSIITGSIIETRQGIEIVARMIDTETAEIIATADVYDEAKDLGALRTLAEGMAIKFHREFPLVGGIVLEKKGKYIFTDLGRDKIKVQRRLIVYREEPVRHPVTGKVLGADTEIIGRARVTLVHQEMSKSELVTGKDQHVAQLDKVITE